MSLNCQLPRPTESVQLCTTYKSAMMAESGLQSDERHHVCNIDPDWYISGFAMLPSFQFDSYVAHVLNPMSENRLGNIPLEPGEGHPNVQPFTRKRRRKPS
jgi:hypothetical protein